ncbi:hypothetical protein LTR53_002844 [Teratosphaeriaceae sp. CCFEE 6253]|nr:hypothetical protein LTR53_002844 [Teratosphaeriaceae sp. CCFEE 6253]
MAEITQKRWEAVVAGKRKQREDAIKPFLSPACAKQDDTITTIADVAELAARIAKREFRTHDVVSAYVRKAAAAHEKTNCLTEIMFSDALDRAHELDEHLEKHGTPVGPLHGVVMTLKDQFNVKDYDTTIGYAGRAYRPATDDALLVEILKGMGVIFIAKSNLPQSIMWCETENPLWGLTTHPLDPAFTPGGSTGGEGVLLAQHASVVGWGTDIGGSVRIPAHMSGLYGFKPSASALKSLTSDLWLTCNRVAAYHTSACQY